ncbi:MAG: transglycosylase SLT domain-containing protein [Spirochaetota bacterium]|nr:transglycosylase SLT domain-containing protein [Spirochaetota bacterium]
MKRKLHFVIFAILYVLLFAFSLNPLHTRESDLQSNNFDLNELKNPKSHYYKTNRFNDASLNLYNLGKKYYNKRKYHKAISYFKQFVRKYPIVTDYGYYYIGLSYYKLRKYNYGAKYFSSIHNHYPNSLFYINAIEENANCLIESSSYDKLIKEFNKKLSVENNKSIIQIYHYYIGYAYQQKNVYKLAVKHYLRTLKLIIKTNQDRLTRYKSLHNDDLDLLKSAMIRLKTFSLDNSVNISSIEKLAIGVGYYFLKDYQNSINFLNKAGTINNETNNFNRLFFKALSYIKMGKLPQAKLILNEIRTKYPSKEGFITVAIEYYNVTEEKSLDNTMKEYKNIIKSYNSYLLIPMAKKLVGYYNTQKDYDKRNEYLRVLVKYGDYNTLWKYLLEDLNFKRLNIIVNGYPDMIYKIKDQEIKSKYLFWCGLAAINLKDYYKAEKFLSTSYLTRKYFYYSYKSLLYIQKHVKKNHFTNGLTDLKNQDQDNQNNLFRSDEYKNRYSKSFFPLFRKTYPSFDRALFFYKAGSPGLGSDELEHFLSSVKDKEKYFRGLTYYFRNNKQYHESIRFAYRLVSYLNGNTENNYIPSDLIKYCYPIYYKKTIEKNSNKYKINKYLVLAVIREESRFNSKAHSWAGARGLMQIMPRTGKYLAKKTNEKKFSLYDIKTNIKFGCYYLAYLIKRFDSYSFALASYNGGPGKISKLLKKASGNEINILTGEHLVELISNNETRNYVKKVLNSYYCYLDLYKN